MSHRIKILFLCTSNSCRSQMAEGFVRHLHPDKMDALSAGIIAKGIDPYAIIVMKEAGIDISSQRSKTVNELGKMQFDFIITLCDISEKNCPIFPSKYGIIHQGFDDPPALAAKETDEKQKLTIYRNVRDRIRQYIENLPKLLTDNIKNVKSSSKQQSF